MGGGVQISAAVEGIVDEAVVRRLISLAGATPGTVYGKRGKLWLRQKIRSFNNAARWAAWVVLVDLDHDYDCAPPLRAEWLPQPAQHLCFRVAVREIEAWFLSDAESLAGFLRVSRNRIPADPERLDHPKAVLVDLARSSRQKAIRDDMVPRKGSGRQVGPAYASRLIEFASSSWRPEVAAQRSDSLTRAIGCLKRMAAQETISLAVHDCSP